MKVKEILFGIGIFLLDQITKYLISGNFFVGQSKVIINNFFSITYVRNTGGAWGIFAGNMLFFYVVSLVAIGYLLYLIFTYKNEVSYLRYALVAILAGAIGNLYDRVLFGFVRDFLDFNLFGYNYPVFNVADIALVLGICVFVFYLFFNSKEKTI